MENSKSLKRVKLFSSFSIKIDVVMTEKMKTNDQSCLDMPGKSNMAVLKIE